MRKRNRSKNRELLKDKDNEPGKKSRKVKQSNGKNKMQKEEVENSSGLRFKRFCKGVNITGIGEKKKY